MGFDVHVIAREFAGSLPKGYYRFTSERIRCSFSKGVMQYAEFNFKLLMKLLMRKADLYLANDLDTTAPNYIVSRLRKKQLIYDTHEYFTGVPELERSPLKKKAWKKLEDFTFSRIKTIYTVNKSLSDQYEAEYGRALPIVRNVPVTKNIPAAAMPQSWAGKKVLLMQGAGINEGRGGIELLEAMKYLPDEYLLVYIGSGTHWDHITAMRKEWGLEHKVEMTGKMPPAQLMANTKLAHIGFTLDKPDDKNYLYNLPNKVFDYMHAGVPIIASPIPEVKKIFDEYPCGILVNAVEPRQIADAVLALDGDPEKYRQSKEMCAKAAQIFCWENEVRKLEDIYQPYL